MIIADLFPAHTTSPDHPKARVIITTDDLYIFVDSPQGPASLLRAPIDHTRTRGNRTTGYDVYLTTRTPQAPPVTIRPTTQCGCGSQLPRFRPFPNTPHTPHPDYPPLENPAS